MFFPFLLLSFCFALAHMLSTQLLYFLGVVFLLTGTSAPRQAWLPWPLALGLAFLGLVLHVLVSWHTFVAARERSAYFRAEKRTFLSAFVLFVFFLYGLDLKFYLKPLVFADTVEGVADLAGLAIFFVLLVVSWLTGRARHQELFYEPMGRLVFVWQQLRMNLPLVLPWVILVAGLDLLRLLLPAQLFALVPTPWNELLVFVFFVVVLLFFLPPLIRRLWNCQPIPPGPLRAGIEDFCRKERFRAGLYYWSYLGGHALTAAILGILPGLRYLLFTPALTIALTKDELISVTAHEIGHVRHHHLLWYLALFFAFSLCLLVIAPLVSLSILASSFFPLALRGLALSPETVADLLSAVPVLVLVLLYFRFVFGFFFRNFERQADLYVFTAMGNADALISSFHTIFRASGRVREKRNWHHFSLSERVAFLIRCQKNPALIQAHQRKLRLALLAYALVVALCTGLALQPDRETLAARAEIQYIEAVLLSDAARKPQDAVPLLMLGDFYLSKNMEDKALHNYEQALVRAPENVTLLNNLAWLLLTAETTGMRDAAQALVLAKQAAMLAQEAFILDTLATAYWAHGQIAVALELEERAIRLDPDNKSFYQEQMHRFRQQHWRENP